MREIKFRAWDERKKEWRYFNFPADFLRCWDIDALNKYPLKNWCEFTGLKDKNGKEIYEGDVVKTLADVGQCEVEWRGNHFGVGFACVDKEGMIVDFDDDWSEMEIIGDIYSNPELLDNKNEYQNREIGTGRYTFEGGLERLCVCSHPLGVHSAARTKMEEETIQDCMNGDSGVDGATGEKCECKCFKPAKRKAAA